MGQRGRILTGVQGEHSIQSGFLGIRPRSRPCARGNQQRFLSELKDLLKNYAGRPTPLYYARRLSETLGGARIFIDPKSFPYLENITLDYEETLMRKGFLFQNPQASRTCGCGTSFAV